MAIRVQAIYRYPVKGLSAEPLERASLTAWDCLPHDRRFALALPTTHFDPERPEWLRKTHFAMLMRDEKLARLRTKFDERSGVFAIDQDGRRVLDAKITEPDGKRQLAEFVTGFLRETLEGPLRVVEAPGHAFSDAKHKPNAKTFKYISLVNLASVRALERLIGVPVDPIRFRANVYFDGAPEWAEHDWVGSEITLGSARLHVVSKTIRCPATQVNPETAVRDMDVPALLERFFNHNFTGVYGEVVGGGEIAAGDALIGPS